jgi:hypothetical protein
MASFSAPLAPLLLLLLLLLPPQVLLPLLLSQLPPLAVVAAAAAVRPAPHLEVLAAHQAHVHVDRRQAHTAALLKVKVQVLQQEVHDNRHKPQAAVAGRSVWMRRLTNV